MKEVDACVWETSKKLYEELEKYKNTKSIYFEHKECINRENYRLGI